MARIKDEINAALPTLSKLVFSQPVDKSDDAKVSVRPVLLKGGLYFQTERVRDNKASHRNLSDEELLKLAQELDGRYRQVLIVSERESAQYCLRAKGGYKKTASAASLPVPGGAKSHNREKQYILAEGENIPALVDLGVFTRDFRVVRSKYDKYRQINRFVELIDHELGSADMQEISILDFGCGKSYLTFILYYYFTVKKGMRAKIIGYDLKADVVERCNEIAARYGYGGLRFECADVTRDKLADEHIDMVVTLHACDVATDYALSYAASRKVRYIFSVPCCQHEVNMSIKKGGELDIFMGQGIIKERMCALLTDSVRECVLKDLGYDVDMIEFIDFEHSPKNIMIRAHYTGRTHTKGRETVKALQERYGFRHTRRKIFKRQTADRKMQPAVRDRHETTFHLPPLCKGRWVAVRRRGGVDAVKCCVIRLFSGKFAAFYRAIPQSRLTPRQLPLHKGALFLPYQTALPTVLPKGVPSV